MLFVIYTTTFHTLLSFFVVVTLLLLSISLNVYLQKHDDYFGSSAIYTYSIPVTSDICHYILVISIVMIKFHFDPFKNIYILYISPPYLSFPSPSPQAWLWFLYFCIVLTLYGVVPLPMYICVLLLVVCVATGDRYLSITHT